MGTFGVRRRTPNLNHRLPFVLQLLPAAEALRVLPGTPLWPGEAGRAPEGRRVLLPRRDGYGTAPGLGGHGGAPPDPAPSFFFSCSRLTQPELLQPSQDAAPGMNTASFLQFPRFFSPFLFFFLYFPFFYFYFPFFIFIFLVFFPPHRGGWQQAPRRAHIPPPQGDGSGGTDAAGAGRGGAPSASQYLPVPPAPFDNPAPTAVPTARAFSPERWKWGKTPQNPACCGTGPWKA